MSGKTLDEFRAAHDPTHKVEAPTTIFERALPKGARRFVVTAAQNATPVHPEFWRALMHFCEAQSAEPLVIPLRYKNPTSTWSGSQQNAEWWAPEARPFLWNARKALNGNLEVLGDIKIQPTASSPLTGAEALSTSSSGIIGHTKVHTRSVATPQNRMAKLVMTSGACTLPNYTDSRAGRLGEFHHSISAVLVELDGKRFFARRLHFDTKTKSITDLGMRYYADRHEPAPPALAVATGDTHVDYIDPLVERATFGDGGLLDAVRAQHVVYHDLLDGYSANPHHSGNPFNAIAKRRNNADDVRAEVERAIEFVRARTRKDRASVVVQSNHDDFLRRWVINTDWRRDPVNAEFYLETALAMTRATQLGEGGTEYPQPFAYWFEKAGVPNARVLRSDESFTLGGVELGMHGDRGPNGARGSTANLRRIGVKSIIGHSHSPAEDEGCVQVGTSTRLRLEYNHGASSWLNAHCVLNADGKRQLVVLVDGKYRI